MWMSSRKLETIPGFHFHITEINSKQQSSSLFNLKLSWCCFWLYSIGSKVLDGVSSCLPLVEFTGRWSCCNMLTLNATNKFCWYIKIFYLTIYRQVFVLYLNPTISTTCKHQEADCYDQFSTGRHYWRIGRFIHRTRRLGITEFLI